MLMDRHFSAVAYVGQHSKANVRGGVMAHSYSSLGIQNMLLSGKPVGEIDVIAAIDVAYHVANIGGDPSRLELLRLKAFKARFIVPAETIFRCTDGRFTVDGRSASKTVSELLREMLIANPGIQAKQFQDLARDKGLGRDRARVFLENGIKAGTVKTGPGMPACTAFLPRRTPFPGVEPRLPGGAVLPVGFAGERSQRGRLSAADVVAFYWDRIAAGGLAPIADPVTPELPGRCCPGFSAVFDTGKARATNI
jgi:hypothetical protein